MHKIFESINLNQYNCDFIDIRIEESLKSEVVFANCELENAIEILSTGAFIRIKHGEKWIYSSITNLDKIEETILHLLKSEGVEAIKDHYQSVIYQGESFMSSDKSMLVFQKLEDKKSIVEPILPILKGDSLIKTSYVAYTDYLLKKYYINSKGKMFSYDKSLSGIMVYYSLKENEDQYSTSYTKTGHYISDYANIAQGLTEDIETAKRFIHAPCIEPGKYSVILSEQAAGIFAHESFGHKSEADFMLGDESMQAEWEIGKKVANEMVSIIDEGDQAFTSGYCPYDDEGNKKQKTYLIKNGILSGRLHSVQTAEELNEEITGNARSINFFYEPIVRMTSTYFDAGKESFESLCKGIQNGFYIEKVNHGSGLSTFTLAINRAWKIENGVISTPVKVNIITGTVFQTLNDIDGLSDQVKIISSAFGGCGKHEQSPLPVSFGGPKIRIKEMMCS